MTAIETVAAAEVVGRTIRGKLAVRWPDGAVGHITYGGVPTSTPACAVGLDCAQFRAACVSRFEPLLGEDFVRAEIARLEADRASWEAEQSRLDAADAAERAACPPPSFDEWVRAAYPTADERWGQGMTGRSCLDVYQARYAARRGTPWPKERSNALERLTQALKAA